MSTDAEDGDYWMNIPASGEATPEVPTPILEATSVCGVEPLGAQLGVIQPLTVPPTLRQVLFGQPDVIEGRAILPLHTYALLDAAKVPGLPEMLETSGLDHACLFQGTAAEELRDVAPWIVQLEEHHKFTQSVFTSGDAPWDMWDNGAGILLRSQGSLAELRRHLRKFTKVRDETNKWYFARFWEPETLGFHLDGLSETGSALQVFYDCGGPTEIAFMAALEPKAAVLRLYAVSEAARRAATRSSAPYVDARYTPRALGRAATMVQVWHPELDGASETDLARLGRRHAGELRAYGIVGTPALANALALLWLTGRSLDMLPEDDRAVLSTPGRSLFARTGEVLARHKARTA